MVTPGPYILNHAIVSLVIRSLLLGLDFPMAFFMTSEGLSILWTLRALVMARSCTAAGCNCGRVVGHGWQSLFCWGIVKIMVLFWVPLLRPRIRPRMILGTPKGTIILTIPLLSCWVIIGLNSCVVYSLAMRASLLKKTPSGGLIQGVMNFLFFWVFFHIRVCHNILYYTTNHCVLVLM